MGNVNLDIRLRPIRFGFLVRPDDKKKTLEIFRINTCLWGGKFNPIIPFFQRLPVWWERKGYGFENARQIINGYLDFFEPDFLVEAEKGLAKGLGYDPKRILQLGDILQKGNDLNCGSLKSHGLSVNDLYRHLYEKEFQFLRRHKHNITHVLPEQSSFANFVSCVFGGFPTQKDFQYFNKNFKDAFDPTFINLNAIELARIYNSGCTSPLRIGHSEIKVEFHEHRDPTLFVLDAHEPKDLIDFWNLRAIHRNVVPIPIQWIEKLAPVCKKFILDNYRPLPGNPYGVMIRPTAMFSRSMSDKVIEEIYKSYIRVDKEGANTLQTWYPPIWREPPEIMARTMRPTLEAESKKIDIQLFEDKPTVNFEILFPKFASTYGNRHRWANIVKIKDWGNRNNIATVFPCSYKHPYFPKFRLGGEHLLPTTEGLVFFPEHINLPEKWELVDGTKAVNSWFKGNEISAVQSDAGGVTQQIIQTLGGFWGVCSLANKGIIELLNEIARKPVTKSAHYLEFKNKIQTAVKHKFRWERSFETLVERKVVELGLELKCNKCGSWSWYSLKQIDYSINCELCLKPYDFPVANPGDRNFSKWSYRVIGPFALPDYARGGYAASLSIRFFADTIGGVYESEVSWSSGQELSLSSGTKLETDFILWYQRKQMFGTDYPTEIVFGEAKSFGKDAFKQDDVDKMKLLAESFPGAVLVFSTMKEYTELSKEETARIRKLAEWGREYDRERKQSRAPVIMLTGTELFAVNNLNFTWEEKGGKHKNLIEPPWVSSRLSNLKMLADFTQQLYLGMQPYSKWREDKWRKKESKGTTNRKNEV